MINIPYESLPGDLWAKRPSCPSLNSTAGVVQREKQAPPFFSLLQFLRQFHLKDLTVTLEREPDNEFDSNAIQIVVHIKPISRRTIIGYVPKELAVELSKVIDMGIPVKAALIQIIGGYSYKEALGVLIDIQI